jgi:hypothetical protein
MIDKTKLPSTSPEMDYTIVNILLHLYPTLDPFQS